VFLEKPLDLGAGRDNCLHPTPTELLLLAVAKTAMSVDLISSVCVNSMFQSGVMRSNLFLAQNSITETSETPRFFGRPG